MDVIKNIVVKLYRRLGVSEPAVQTDLEISDLQCHSCFTTLLPMPGTSMCDTFDPWIFLNNKVGQVIIIQTVIKLHLPI